MKKTKKNRQTRLPVISFVLLFIFVTQTVFAQTQSNTDNKYSIEFKNEQLSSAFKKLEKVSGYNMLFTYEDLQQYRVTSSFINQTLIQILDDILKDKPLKYTISNKNVTIVKKQQVPQRVMLTGKVTDQRGAPLIGVTVRVIGSTGGTVTNADGRYSLTHLVTKETELEFTYIGMKAVKVKYNGKNTIDMVMHEKAEEVEEVVVTGYQQIDRRHLTSAVTTVKMDDIDVPGVNRLDIMLEGRIPGLTYMQNTGQVGATPRLRIRGTSTILGSQEPLWVVDGIIQQDPVNVDIQQLNNLDFVNLLGNAISGLNPDDIEQINVLKDAAATALYGARAANGVIVVTTKKGKVGPPTVSYSMSGTFTSRPRHTDRGFNMMDSKERVALSRELMERGVRYNGAYDGVDNWIGYEKAYLDYYKEGNISFDEFSRLSQYYETMNTDWLGILTQDVFSHNHSLSINGGTQNVRYYASLGLADEQGNVKGEFNKRYSTSMKLTANYDKFLMQLGLNASHGDKSYNPDELNVMSYASSMSRAIPLYGEDGELWYYNKTGTGASSASYPFNIRNEMNNSSRDITSNTISMNAQVQYKFTDYFRLMAVGSYSFSSTDDEKWFGEDSWTVAELRGSGGSTSLLPFGGKLNTSSTRNNSYTLRLQADYSKYIGKDKQHFINAMGCYELSSSEYNTVAEEVRGYYHDRGRTFVDLSGSINDYAGADFTKYYQYYKWLIGNSPTYSDALTNMMSAYLTFTYGYKNRYIFNFNTRADWSNAFGSRSNEKLLPVWSVSGRWNMTEDILKDISWIDNMALRFSYGIQGNMLNQPTRMTINKGSYNAASGGYVSTVKDFPNPDLKWEKTHSYNVGLDFSFLDGKMRGSVAYFYKKTRDAFMDKRVASQNGVTTYTVNAGDVENKGVELSLNFTPIDRQLEGGKHGFIWRIDPQIGQTLNTLINKAININNPTLQDEITVTDLLNGSAYIAGTPLNTFYSYRYAGLDKTGTPTFFGLEDNNQEELRARYDEMAQRDKKEAWLAILGESGTRVPVIQGGINNYFAYRNFSLSVNLTYSLGNKIRLFKLCSGSYSAIRPLPHNNVRAEFVDRWRYPGDEQHTDIPSVRIKSPGMSQTEQYEYYGWWMNESGWRPTASSNTGKYAMYDLSDLRVANGDYLRIASVIFRYTLPKEWIGKFGLSHAYVSLSGSNLHTFCSKKLKGQNPEQSGTSDIVNISIRPSYTFSVNINF
ncbi:MAG: SusC/RagA family TonB-linked outer membrane protein [Bacteroidales bacterium]|nr:SusC/RagA family TonB-linked outer membrane protein [Bacteroidales bacterium]MDD3989214.1 SusC/RagA family TonB-linked outer membrane protein [Bacteroidales bacterium]